MLHPLPPGPKGKEGSCWAAYTQAPSKSYQQGRATSGHHSGRQPCTRRNTPLLSKAPVLRLMYLHLAHKMALTEKLCSLFSLLFSPCLCHQAHHWPWTDSEKDCHLLKHHIIFPHSWFSLLTCPQVTQPAGSCWFHPRGGVWGTQLKAAYFQ